jgi:hypothetical protein
MLVFSTLFPYTEIRTPPPPIYILVGTRSEIVFIKIGKNEQLRKSE